jgi:DNA-binding NtrC family response regulator
MTATDGGDVDRDIDAATFAELNLIGRSPVFLEALRLVNRMAGCDAAVLIQGETGSGKELAARAIHYLGARASGPFIPINCGALPEGLLESELFGHVRGAFTDAKHTHRGMIAEARGGTLFLDEVDTLQRRGQVALLRFLQDHAYRPVGGTLVHDADVRVIAASNRDLGTLAASDRFRRDLLYRLNVLTLDMPPLRERGDDVVMIAEAFLARAAARRGQPCRRIDAQSASELRRHDWPGNVRELENLIERTLVLSDGPALRLSFAAGSGAGTPGDAGSRPREDARPKRLASFSAARAQTLADFERRYLTDLLKQAAGNVSLAARLSGKERSRLGKLIRKHGLSAADFRTSR